VLDDRSGIILEVVGRQRVIARANEGLEELPCSAGSPAE
jgi:hypothetical protein